MKKVILVLLTLATLFSLVACMSGDSAEEHSFVSHEAKVATCEEDGNNAYYTCSDCDKIFDANKQEIDAIPVISALGHDYVLNSGKTATCVEDGEMEHYTCSRCDKLFDLDKNEITSVSTAVDEFNHASTSTIVADVTNVKTTYKAGETFDPMGIIVTCKCESCDGYTVDNQFLTYVYQGENATAFALNDTKVTVVFNEMSFDVTVTVTKDQAVISGVEQSYETSCGVAPVIEATANNQELDIVIEYYDAENQKVEATNFVEGATYTAKIYIEETDEYLGTEVTATVTVDHKYEWKETAEDWKKVIHTCICGDTKDYYVMNYQSPYVDEDDLAIDLSAFVCGTENVTVKEVKQSIRVKDGNYLNAVDGEVVDIEYTNDGFVYSFSASKYEDVNGFKPYILTLLVTYEVEGAEFNAYVEAKLIDKLIKTAEDLKLLSYIGASDENDKEASDENDKVAYEDIKYYALANDINAESVEFNSSMPAWHESIGFRGVLEGNGYTISNLKITGGHGLFGALGNNAKIQNVNFTNVYVPVGHYALAYACRNAYMTNVNFEFDIDSPSKQLFYSANNLKNEDNTYKFNNVTIKTCIEDGNPFLVEENAENEIPETVVISYYDYYTVEFDTDGAGEIKPVFVTAGKTLKQPEIQTKESEDEAYEYSLTGWSFNGVEWNFNDVVTENMTLVAKWEKTEKTPENVLLNAKNQTLAKWDYGKEITVGNATDDTYGAVWTVVISEVDEQSISHSAIDTKDYTQVYFHIYNPCRKVARLTVHGGYGDGWSLLTKEIAAGWSQVVVDASAFAKGDAGKIYLVLQDIDAVSIAGEWKITSFYGLKEGENAPEIEDPNKPTAEKVEASLDFGIRTDTGTTNEYGKVYNISQEEWFIEHENADTIGTLQTNKLANALPSGYVYFEFYMYNPTDTEYNFHLAGDCNGNWTDSADSTPLTPKAWTKITISSADIELNTQGQWYVYIIDPSVENGNGDGATKDGWQITTIYAVC